jgi:putative protease
LEKPRILLKDNALTLRSVFSRSGFTDGYLTGKKNVDMFGYRVKEDVTSATTVLKELENSYKNEIRPNKASAKFILKRDEPATLLFSSKGASVKVQGEIPQEPRTAPLSEEIALRNLSKLGDTSFYLDSMGFENEDSLTPPASAINALRRDAANLLEEELSKKEYIINNVTPHIPYIKPDFSKPKTRIRLESFSQYSDAFEKADSLILPLEEIINNLEEIIEYFKDKIDYIIEDKEDVSKISSTIVDVSKDKVVILRQGDIKL